MFALTAELELKVTVFPLLEIVDPLLRTASLLLGSFKTPEFEGVLTIIYFSGSPSASVPLSTMLLSLFGSTSKV